MARRLRIPGCALFANERHHLDNFRFMLSANCLAYVRETMYMGGKSVYILTFRRVTFICLHLPDKLDTYEKVLSFTARPVSRSHGSTIVLSCSRKLFHSQRNRECYSSFLPRCSETRCYVETRHGSTIIFVQLLFFFFFWEFFFSFSLQIIQSMKHESIM